MGAATFRMARERAAQIEQEAATVVEPTPEPACPMPKPEPAPEPAQKAPAPAVKASPAKAASKPSTAS